MKNNKTLPSRQSTEHPLSETLIITKRDACFGLITRSVMATIRDPYETTNLFDSGEHQDVIARLTGQIHAWQELVSDQVEVG